MLSPRAAAAMSSRQPCMPGAPFGPVAARISRRTSAGRTQRDLLRDEPADREPEEVDLVEAERGDERDHVPGRVRDGRSELAARGADARVVDQDDLALGCERVGERWIPVVQVAAEVLQHHERQVGRAPEAAVGELHACGLDELGLSGVVAGLCGYGRHPRYLRGRWNVMTAVGADVDSLMTGCP